MAELLRLSIDQVFIDYKNPRYLYKVDDDIKAIDKLCQEENVYELAKDISAVGLNPMDIFGVTQQNDNYIVVEGNRRLCAIKLLDDPELSPIQRTLLIV